MNEYLESLSAADREALQAVLADRTLAVQTFFRIKDMKGQLVPFRFNRAQRLLVERGAGHRFLMVLKARKVGVSSKRFAEDIWTCATTKGQHRICLAQSDEDVTKIYDTKVRPMLANCLIPIRSEMRAGYIYFPETDSRYYIGTAGSTRFGRGSDITGFHFTEYAHWDSPDVVAGIEEGLVDGADGLIETTANGHNFFRTDWVKSRRGENRYRAVFLPWMVHEDYAADASALGPISAEEQRLLEALSMTPEQLAWRRGKIRDMRDPALFPQEYPETDEQAFLSSNRPVFDWLGVARMRAFSTPPHRQGNLFESSKRIELNLDPKGPLKLWKLPEERHVYSIGADIAEGIQGGAYSVAHVLDLGTGEQVAEWHGHIAPDLFGEELYLLSRYYNHAIVADESYPGPGAVTHNTLERLGARLWADEKGNPWETNSRTKTNLILSYAGAIRDHDVTIRSSELLDEMTSYIYDDRGHMVPSTGSFSDRIIAAALAYHTTRDIAGRVNYYKAPKLGQDTFSVGGTSVPKFKRTYGVRE